MARELNIRITGDDSSAAAALTRTEAGLKRVTTETKTVDATWSRLSQQQTTAASTVVKNTEAVATSTSTLKDVAIGMAEGFAASVITVQAFEMAARAAAAFIGDSIKQYLEAEQVQRKMVAALQDQGLAIPYVISQYDALSKKYEDLTVNSDEAIKSAITLLAQVGGVLPTQMDAALRAVTNLSAGLDIDLKTAAIAVARGFEDGFMQLHRWIPELDTATAKAEGMDYVLGVIAKHFDGAALADVESYAGQIKKLGNEWDDFKESVGQAAVESGSLNVLLAAASVAIGILTEDLKKIIGDFATLFAAASLFDPTGMAERAVVGLAKALNDLNTAGKDVHKTFLDLDKLSDSDFAAMVRQLAEADWAKHAADRAKAAKEATEELKRAAKAAADELTRYETMFLGWLDDANLRSKAFTRSLHDGTESALAGVIRLSSGIGDLSELLRNMPTFNPPGNSGTNVPIPGLTPIGPTFFGAPPPDIWKQINSDADRYRQTLGLIGHAMNDLGDLGGKKWQTVNKFIQQGIGLLEMWVEHQRLVRIADKLATSETIAGHQAMEASAAVATQAANMMWAAFTLGASIWITVLTDLYTSSAQAAQQMQADLKATRDGWIALGYTAQEVAAMWRAINALPNEAAGNLARFEAQLTAAQQRSTQITHGIDDLGKSLEIFGGHAPAALRPFIESLIAGGHLTQEQIDRLRAFSQAPSWKDIQKHAEELGVSIDALGNGFQQSKLNDQAREFFARFTEFTDVGGDPRGILEGMADEFQGLIDRARQFGLTIPEFLKPILQQMIQFGLLHDAAGNNLTELLNIQFSDLKSPLDEAVDWLAKIYGVLSPPPTGGGGAVPRNPPAIPVPPGSGGGGRRTTIVNETPGDITIGVYVDGRKFTEDVTVPNLPGAVRAKFGT